MNASRNQNVGWGFKQLIERKQGLFRMHMMGKRVNYAARTVICPDPNIGIDEIGLEIEHPFPLMPLYGLSKSIQKEVERYVDKISSCRPACHGSSVSLGIVNLECARSTLVSSGWVARFDLGGRNLSSRRGGDFGEVAENCRN